MVSNQMKHWLWLLSVCNCIRLGVHKCIARPTSRCRRTEAIVSLRKMVYSCTELQVFSCYRGWMEACQATRAISTKWRRELSLSVFSCKARCSRKFTQFWQTLGEHAPSYVTVKNWVAHFKRGDFSTCDAPHPGRPKQWPSWRLLIKFTR